MSYLYSVQYLTDEQILLWCHKSGCCCAMVD